MHAASGNRFYTCATMHSLFILTQTHVCIICIRIVACVFSYIKKEQLWATYINTLSISTFCEYILNVHGFYACEHVVLVNKSLKWTFWCAPFVLRPRCALICSVYFALYLCCLTVCFENDSIIASVFQFYPRLLLVKLHAIIASLFPTPRYIRVYTLLTKQHAYFQTYRIRTFTIWIIHSSHHYLCIQASNFSI